MSELPFELYKYHKAYTKKSWRYKQISFRDDGHFNYVYNEYIHATNCELCNKLFTRSQDRQLDHCHNTGDPRNIVCCRCNTNRKDNKKRHTNTGEPHICKRKHRTYTTGYCFRILILRDGKPIIDTARKTIEEAIKCRDKFIDDNPGIYT